MHLYAPQENFRIITRCFCDGARIDLRLLSPICFSHFELQKFSQNMTILLPKLSLPTDLTSWIFGLGFNSLVRVGNALILNSLLNDRKSVLSSWTIVILKYENSCPLKHTSPFFIGSLKIGLEHLLTIKHFLCHISPGFVSSSQINAANAETYEILNNAASIFIPSYIQQRVPLVVSQLFTTVDSCFHNLSE